MAFIHTLKNKPWQLSLIAGISLGLAFPPIPLPFLAFVGIACLFRLADLTEGFKSYFFKAYPAFLIWNAIVSYWLSMATVAGGIAAVIAKAIVMCILFYIPVWIHQKFQFKPNAKLIFLALSLVAVEYIDFFWDLSYPWLLLGNAWAMVLPLMQNARFGGVFIVSFWSALGALLLYLYWIDGHLKQHFTALLLFVALAFSSIYSYYFSPLPESTTTEKVLVVQPNHDSYAAYNGFNSYRESNDSIIQMTDSALAADATIQSIYWPENAVEPYLSNMSNKSYERDIQFAVNRWKRPLITGTAYRQFYNTSTDSLPLIVENRHKTYAHQTYNSSLLFTPFQSPELYIKNELVPLVEKIPFQEFLVKTHLFGMDWEAMTLYNHGENLRPFILQDSVQTQVMICYDSAFPELGKEATTEGSDFLTVITNDGWWGHSSGHIQHYMLSKIRAIENGRYVVRAANNGISAIIDPKGNALIETEFWTKTAFSYDVPLVKDQTSFSTYGNWLGNLSLFLTAFAFLQSIAGFLTNPERKQKS